MSRDIGREKPPSKDGAAQRAAAEVAGLKEYVGELLFRGLCTSTSLWKCDWGGDRCWGPCTVEWRLYWLRHVMASCLRFEDDLSPSALHGGASKA